VRWEKRHGREDQQELEEGRAAERTNGFLRSALEGLGLFDFGSVVRAISSDGLSLRECEKVSACSMNVYDEQKDGKPP
jgi:hypothetical protein